ncbi:MAG: phosphorylase [Acidobacteriia bacterium]|nr:phosphorylase [Terriglobia bacterium]
MPVEIAIIAAMEREVRSLVRHWPRRDLAASDLTLPAFAGDGVLVICSGIGARLARQAAVAVFASHRPRVIVSAGLAGALDSSLEVGTIFQPATVVDAATGARFNACGGSGILLTVPSVLDRDAKGRLTGSYGAAAADMEAAGVALVAGQHGCGFIALKAISDVAGFPMPSFERFIDARGRLRTARLLLASAVRPARWLALARLGINSSHASRELSRALAHLIEQEGAALQPALSGNRS